MSDNDIGHEWDGEATTWPRHKLRIAKFKRANAKEFDNCPWFFTAEDPKKRGRWTEDYTVPEPESDDEEPEDKGSGAEPGTKLKKESASGHKKAIRLYKEANATWFTILAASIIGGQAEEEALRMQTAGNEDGKMLEKTIMAECETKSNQHASHLFKAWVSEHKSPKTTIEDHNKQWNRTLDIINTNLDWETMTCYLYLISLGPLWSVFYDHMTTRAENAVDINKMSLKALQRAAVDWMRTHKQDTSDEAKGDQIAFQAQEQSRLQRTQRGTKRKRTEHELTSQEKRQRPCIQCGHPIHNWYGCFKGGLDWMDAGQRAQYIEAERIKRGYYGNNQNHRQNHSNNQTQNNHQNKHSQQQQQQSTESAALAQLQKQHKDQMHVLEETLRSKHLHGIANELNDAGFDLDLS